MTQPISAPPANDPWAAAGPAQQTASAPQQSSTLAAGLPAPSTGSSLLLNPGASAPSLFNKTHFLGTSRTGIITKTEDKQDQDFNAKAPKYWSLSKVGGEMRNRATTTDVIDQPTGQPNKPVMVAHISLDTDYRMDQGEALAVNRPADYGQTDDGKRVLVVGGFDLKTFYEAVGEARARGIVINVIEDLIGKRITATRSGQVPPKNGVGNPSWVMSYRIDNA